MRAKKRGPALPAILCVCLALAIPAAALLLRQALEPDAAEPEPSAAVQREPAPEPAQDEGDEGGEPSTPAGYEWVEVPHDDLYKGDLILVNNGEHYQFPASEEETLVTIFENKNNAYSVKNKEVSLQNRVMEPLNEMLDDFNRQAAENRLLIISGQRTREYQEMLFNNRAAAYGEEDAARWVAAPGGSEHHTGLAIDFGLYDAATDTSSDYTGEGAYAWINENCKEYGFIVRFDEEKSDLTGILYEPWHFRYIGRVHAELMTEKGFCLEEYIDYLRRFPFEGEHLKASVDGEDTEIYFVPASEGATSVPVPESGDYALSGNNVDGFIVTARL